MITASACVQTEQSPKTLEGLQGGHPPESFGGGLCQTPVIRAELVYEERGRPPYEAAPSE